MISGRNPDISVVGLAHRICESRATPDLLQEAGMSVKSGGER